MPSLAPLGPGVSAAGALDRGDIEALAAHGVRTIVNNRLDGEDRRQLPAAEAGAIAAGCGVAYHHIPFTGPGPSKADVDAFAAVLASAEQPIVVHCRSGTRSALLWALVRLREGDDPAALIAQAKRYRIDIAALPAIARRIGL
jgi:uncharacterized protein (TIGR01244 family)